MFSIILVFCIVFDISSRKIPNTAIAIGIIFGLYDQGTAFMIPFTAVLVLFYPLFFFRMIGAGDVKLMAVLAGVLGYQPGSSCILLAWLLAAGISFLKLLHYHSFQSRISYFLDYFRQIYQTRQIVPYYNPERDGQDITIPFSLPLGIAYFCILFSGLAGGN